MMNKKVAAAIILGVAILFTLAVTRAFGSTAQPRPNSLGVTETYQNPMTYLLALPIDGKILDGRFTNIRFQPYAAASLFDESILFCGDVSDQFDGKSGPLVMTYRTQASGMFEGVGCHTLVSAFTVNGQ
jgi:hypothetical protein